MTHAINVENNFYFKYEYFTKLCFEIVNCTCDDIDKKKMIGVHCTDMWNIILI